MLGEGDERFASGLGEILRAYDVPLLGGDTVRAPGRRVWGCTAVGRATGATVPDRRGARVGEAIYVTGMLGRAMLGMDERGSGSANDLAYRRPRPLLAEGQALAGLASAMMDVSDGLLLDAWRMAQASSAHFAIEAAAVPVADPGRAEECMRWGDDYQLLFTAPRTAALPVLATRIGTVSADRTGLSLDGAVLDPDQGLGYQH